LQIGVLEDGGIGQFFGEIFTQKGTYPTNHFCMDRKANKCLTTLSLTVFMQRNIVSDFLLIANHVCFHKNMVVCPPGYKGKRGFVYRLAVN